MGLRIPLQKRLLINTRLIQIFQLTEFYQLAQVPQVRVSKCSHSDRDGDCTKAKTKTKKTHGCLSSQLQWDTTFVQCLIYYGTIL